MTRRVNSTRERVRTTAVLSKPSRDPTSQLDSCFGVKQTVEVEASTLRPY